MTLVGEYGKTISDTEGLSKGRALSTRNNRLWN